MKIFSENEWSPLKEVIVGNVFENYSFDVDLSFKLFFKDNYGWGLTPTTKERIPFKKQYIEELKEDIAGFVDVLEREKINIHRPNTLSEVVRRSHENWSTEIIPALNVRDQTIIIGDTIVETSPCQRCRRWENDLLQDIFKEAEGNNWLKMPKSAMRDENFDHDLIEQPNQINNTVIVNSFDLDSDISPDIEMMIDGANCVRFGKDIIINVADRNQYLGYLWFKENFPEKNWHLLHAITNNHLDSFIVPLCEGVLMLRDDSILERLPDFLRDWKIIYPPKTTDLHFPVYDANDVLLASPYIDMNVLSLDGNKIITNSLFPELSEFLYAEGFDPIPVQHRHRRLFSGGFHCFTVDLLREHHD